MLPELAFFYVKKVFPDTLLDETLNIKQPFKLIDLFILSIMLAINYDELHTHRNRKNKDKEMSKLILDKAHYLLRIREKGLPEFSLTHPKLMIISYKRSGEPSIMIL
jgi:hypothetical protein